VDRWLAWRWWTAGLPDGTRWTAGWSVRARVMAVLRSWRLENESGTDLDQAKADLLAII